MNKKEKNNKKGKKNIKRNMKNSTQKLYSRNSK